MDSAKLPQVLQSISVSWGGGGNNPPLITIPKKGSVLLKHPQHWGVPFPLQMWGTRKAAGRQRLFAIRNEVLIRHRMPAMCSSPVASFIAGRAMQKNTSHSFFPPPPSLYPVYAANKFNFQELESQQSRR